MNQNNTTGHNNERGSLVTFLIVGVTLLALMSGIVYVAAQRSSVNDQLEDTEVAQQEQAEETEQGQSEDESVPEEDATEDEAEPAAEDQQADGEEPADSLQIAGTDDNDAESTGQGSTQTPRTGPSEELPQTGPGEVILSITSLAVLAYVVLRYAQSRNYHPVK